MSKMRAFFFPVLACAVLSVMLLTVSEGQALAKEKTWTWTGQAFCARANRLFENGQDFAYMIEKYTDGRIKIDFHSAGEIVPAMQVYDAAGQGIIDFGQACPCVAKSKAYAAQWFCDAPGAQSPIEKLIWYYHGGGKEIMEDIYHKKYHTHPLPMVAITTEIWIYSNKKINTLEDLTGMKMRAAGVRGEVLTQMGASVVVLPGSEMVPAMERGVIDAMEYSSINCTFDLGFCDVTKYLYMHPSKSTAPMNIWAVNLDRWNELPDDVKEAVERASRDAYMRSLVWGIEQDFLTLKRAVEEKGNELLILPEEVAHAVDEASADFYYEKAKKDKELARLLDSWAEFKKNYGAYAKWLDYLNMTGDHLGLVKGDS
jgi:TRAP-type mannitol/chloroaromatic compound transport system substrate-binding protein